MALIESEPEVAATPSGEAARSPDHLVEWWRDDAEDPDEPQKPLPSLAETEQRQMRAIGTMIGAVVACAALGWLAGPLLTPLMERFTGTNIDDPGSLRSLGAFLGLLTGMLVGATSGWIFWSSK